MEKYYKMVIDLYRSAVENLSAGRNVNNDCGMAELTAIANAITTARVNGNETAGLEQLKDDIEHLRLITDSL